MIERKMLHIGRTKHNCSNSQVDVKNFKAVSLFYTVKIVLIDSKIVT